MVTEFDGDCLPRGINFMEIVCPGEVGKSGSLETKWVQVQMHRSQLKFQDSALLSNHRTADQSKCNALMSLVDINLESWKFSLL